MMLIRINFLMTLILMITIYLIWMGFVLFFGLFVLVKTMYLERPWSGGANNQTSDPDVDLSSSTPPTHQGGASFLESRQDDH